MTILNWKTIDKLEAKVPGVEGNYRGWTEFDVKLGRAYSPLRIDIGDDDSEDSERFAIENKTLDIRVEGKTLREAKQRLREKLAASDDFNGKWTLWMKVDADGGYAPGHIRNSDEYASCTIRVEYYLQLVSGKAGKRRARHMALREALPTPFTGEFAIPTTHKELSRLQSGGLPPQRDTWNKDDVWVIATPELVETLRALQRRLGESGAQVQQALSLKKFSETIKAVQEGHGQLLLGPKPVEESHAPERLRSKRSKRA